MSIKKRAFKAINLKQYKKVNKPEIISSTRLYISKGDQRVLRMLIKKYDSEIMLPPDLYWCQPLIDNALAHQSYIGVSHPFCYLTIRRSIADYKKDDEWHVDGFSTKFTHIPEQNYVWCDKFPTQVANKSIKFPKDFNPRIHNVHSFIQNEVKKKHIETLKDSILYCMDPYVIHRRDPSSTGEMRTFVRISFTPIEIDDVNNTFNPLLPTDYKRDGILDFRNRLINYQNEKE